jgi:hypothetical protein
VAGVVDLPSRTTKVISRSAGGAVVAACNDERHRESVALALAQDVCGTVCVNRRGVCVNRRGQMP